MASVSIFFGSQTGAADSIAQSKVFEKPEHHVIVVCSTTGNGDPPDNAGKFWRFVKRRSQPSDLLAKLRFTVLGLGDTNYDRFCYMGKSIDKRFAELGAQRFYATCAADEALGLEDSVEPWAAGLWAAFDKSAGFNSGASSDPKAQQDEVAPNTATLSSAASTSQADNQGAVKALPPFLPANLITYEKMFGPFSGATETPEDTPKLPAALFSLRFINEETTVSAATAGKEEIGDSAATEIEYSLSHPFEASIVGARYLTSHASERKVLGLEIDISGSSIRYSPGDSIGIKCPNRADDVDALLARLGANGEMLFRVEAAAPAPTGRAPRRAASAKSGPTDRFPSPCSVREAFLHHADILRTPKKAALRALATFCSDEEERARLLVLSSKSGADKYKEFVDGQQLNFIEILYLFPSCNPPLEHFLSLLPQLMPRYYSIASSPLANPDCVTIALTVVENAVGASGIIPIYLRSTRDFRPPVSHEWPLLLIGPGTGVAPFIGFLQHRYLEKQSQASDAASESKGNYLFFGNRRRSEDWIFQHEMQEFVANGTLRGLFTAFSRDQDDKHYVQHDLRAHGELVADLLLASGGYAFVCGDGVQMARDVHETLRDILEEHGKLSKDDAEAQLKALAANQRYVRDIWG
ncbi:hypothetical protein PybrP1_010469 [[Pythium] brassicae (nom. inval.)]|nr:hypothetical protein PybrP1_010469 [[Pythium] brassicae (nom. inval.)]